MEVTKFQKKSLNKVRLVYFLIIFTMVLVVPSAYTTQLYDINLFFIFTNSIIGFVSLTMIVRESKRYNYSLNLIHWLFHYTFFFIAPLVQYLNDSFPWGSLHSSDTSLLIKSNWTIILWQIFWIASTRLVKVNPVEKDRKDAQRIYVGRKKTLQLTFMSWAVLALFLYIYGFGGLFGRGAQAVNSFESSSLMLFILFSCRAVPVASLSMILVRVKSEKRMSLMDFFLLANAWVIVILTNFPSATPRFWTAGVFLGLAIMMFKFRRNTLVYVIFFGLNIIFPILGSARNAKSITDFIKLADGSTMFMDNLLIGDYDAFSMINYTWMYIDNFGTTLGKQLMTVLLFFVPRSLWLEKSVGSGKLVADSLGLWFDNVSSSLLAEGMINFGLMGLVIFALVFSLMCRKLDYLFWKQQSQSVIHVYPFWIGFFFFIMRGDMLSSLSFVLGFTAIFLLFKPKTIHLVEP